MWKTWLFVVCVLGSLCLPTQAQGCIDPCDLPLQYCTNVDYPISPYNLNVTESEREANVILSMLPLIKAVFPECGVAMQKFSCGRVYPSCRNDTTPVQTIKPCLSMCTEVNTICASAIATGKSLNQFTPEELRIINCSITRPDNTPWYESDETKCVNLTNITPLPCFNSSQEKPTPGCQKYDASLAPNTSAICAPFVSSEIYVANVNDTTALSSADTVAAGTIKLLMEVYPLIPTNCFKRLASLLCQSSFPTCVHVNESYVAPSPHCNEFCEESLSICSSIFGTLGAGYSDLFSCSVILGPTASDTNCNSDLVAADASPLFALPMVTSCPSVMGLKMHPAEDEAPCGYPCPDRTYTSKQINGLIGVVLTLGSISFTLLVILGISQILVAEKRVYPMSLQQSLCLILSLMMTSFFLGGTNPQKDVWCADAGTYSTQHSNHRCAAQAFMFSYFGLAATCLCFVLAATLFLAVVLGVRVRALERSVSLVNIFIWGAPLPFIIVAIAKKKFGYMPMLPFCFIVFEDITHLSVPQSSGLSIDWPLFFIPAGVLALTSIILFSITMARITLVRLSVKGQVAFDSGVSKQAERRVGIFILFLSGIIITILEWRVEIEARGIKSLETNVMNWFICKIKTELNLPDPGGPCPGDTTPSGISYGHLMLICVLASSLGIVVFGIFGFDKNNYKVWPLVYETIFKTQDFAELWRVIKNGPYRAAPPSNLSTKTNSRNTGGGVLVNSNSSLQSGDGENESYSFELELSSSAPRE